MSVVAQGRVVDFPVARAFVPFLQPARYKGAHGGRGSAKSHDRASALIKRCVEKPGTRWVCVREVQKSLEQSVKRLLEDKIKFHKVEDQFEVTLTQIRTPGGGVILFQGMQDHTAESIKSLEGMHGAWVEEAQSLSARSLELLTPTIRLEWCRHCSQQGPMSILDGQPCKPGFSHKLDPSELWFTWNPRHKDDPVDRLLRGEERPPDSVVIEVNYQDNPWFPDVLRNEMEWDKRRDLDKYLHVWDGGYESRGESRVFKNWRVEAFEPAADWEFYWGADWGFSVDPSTLVRLRADVEQRTLYIDRELYKIGVEIDHLPAFYDTMVCGCIPSTEAGYDGKPPATCPDKKAHGEARRWAVVADSARPETISYMNRHGYPRMTSAKKGAGSVAEGVIFLQGWNIVVHPRCVQTEKELTHYSYKVNKLIEPGKPGYVLPILADEKNHIIDPMRYALEDLMAAIGASNLGFPVDVPDATIWSRFDGGSSEHKPGTADWQGVA